METTSRLTCPECGHVSVETMPTDACIYFFDCPGCGALLRPKKGDCCVFCSYGSVPLSARTTRAAVLRTRRSGRCPESSALCVVRCALCVVREKPSPTRRVQHPSCGWRPRLRPICGQRRTDNSQRGLTPAACLSQAAQLRPAPERSPRQSYARCACSASSRRRCPGARQARSPASSRASSRE